ncbi:maleylpyruvate isomerase N-terminal domain-containing protein [Actibacterium ureilyticum]|uniref:maleylpyruvate isomerase N-terminal domain-containing protein n=1 Tax=Actibacterium ureilyticum TaxID=1590614 RepID=UPI001C3EF91B|nr:maleylpyruvate isomerase N-terminal domain-containing protein [Actibacterium ureilyticum]
MITIDDAARADLRARQGAGARYDAPGAPAAQLAWARRGTAYFARLLNDLSPADLDRPSRMPGWSRRHLVAHVAYNGRAFANMAGAVRAGDPAPLYPSVDMRTAEITRGATLPDRALRHLFQHAEVHLNVEWRDLTDGDWQKSGTGLDGAPLPIADTPLLRARELWLHALDLDAGARARDVPRDLLAALAADADTTPDAYLATHAMGRRPLGQPSPSDMPEDWPF